MSHTFAYAIRIGTRGILKQDGVGLGDACLTNASEQVPPKNSSTGSTGHLQPPSWNKKNLPVQTALERLAIEPICKRFACHSFTVCSHVLGLSGVRY